MTSSCSNNPENPFFQTYQTPFETPPFDLIRDEHYLPAFEEGMVQQRKEIDIIADNDAGATFENTVAALDRSGALLTRVGSVFFNLKAAHTNDQIQEIARELVPKLSRHNDDIILNAKLFQRIKTVYEKKDEIDLTGEEQKLLEKYYRDFVRGGANLSESGKARLRQLNERLSVLSVQFGDNVLAEDNAFELIIDNKEDLAGLTEASISTAAETAKELGHAGKWVFTLHKPSMIPFLQYSERRELREEILRAYINRGNNGDTHDNKNIVAEMISLRVQKAGLLGYETHADFILEENMAKDSDRVFELLNKIWQPALVMAKKEAYELQSLIYSEGDNFKLQPWDWRYYAEKLKKQKYDLDEKELRPYFELSNVRRGVFEVANKLYGITFSERTDIQVYHPDVRVYEVKESDGSHIGILYTDYFPRSSKRGGAWMNAYRSQHRIDGEMITPVIVNVGNLSKPTADQPALLSFSEVETLFHEFGHALHGLLSDCTYKSISGTNVPRDFVELPSQIMENWASAPDVLKSYARHFQTGEPIPDALIEKIQNAGKFNQGFATTEYLAAAFLDMNWHIVSDTTRQDVISFEEDVLGEIGLIPEIVVRYRSPYFQHIFSGGYSAGYYSYIWAEVLDADAFQAFRENGLFDRETAESFRQNILAAGGTEDPMKLYTKFRGAEPKIDALLERRGLN
jgi:peptidyl-dipeptidase Dcp